SVSIVVERMDRGKDGRLWLFSKDTLASIPELYAEVGAGGQGSVFDRLLAGTRLESLRVLGWLAPLLGLVVLYLAAVLADRALAALIRPTWRRVFRKVDPPRDALPVPVRLLVAIWVGRRLLAGLSLPLVVRQFWSNAASIVTIAAIVWLLILVNGEIEESI